MAFFKDGKLAPAFPESHFILILAAKQPQPLRDVPVTHALNLSNNSGHFQTIAVLEWFSVTFWPNPGITVKMLH